MREFFRIILKLSALYIKRWIVRFRIAQNREMLNELLSPMSRLMIIAPHPDDEVFGLGGLMLTHFHNNRYNKKYQDLENIFICYLTDGESSVKEFNSNEVAAKRIAISTHVMQRLKIPDKRILRLHLPDGLLSAVVKNGFREMQLDKIEAFMRENRVSVILTTHLLDYWPTDHVVAFRMGEELSKRTNCNLYAYWVWTWFNQNIFQTRALKMCNFCRIPISEYLKEKKYLIRMYMRPKTNDGRPWSGVLPLVFLKSNSWKYEVVERVR